MVPAPGNPAPGARGAVHGAAAVPAPGARRPVGWGRLGWAGAAEYFSVPKMPRPGDMPPSCFKGRLHVLRGAPNILVYLKCAGRGRKAAFMF